MLAIWQSSDLAVSMAIPGGKRHSTGMANVEEGPGAVSLTPIVPNPTTLGPVEATDGARWGWARHWELWLALALAAILRVWRLDLTQFLDDQAGLMVLARQGVLRHVLPITGIPSSITALNPPLSVYLLMPFAAVSANPLPAIVALALWNVLGVAFCYVFALRYFGRRVAATGALLFATCGGAIQYSRFLWQQNFLPPVIALWAITLYAGCVRGRRGWHVPNAALLLAAILLHPTAAVFIPVTVVAALLAPRQPRPREYAAVAAGVAVLLAPTALFELLSHGFDIRQYLHYARGGAQLDLSVLPMFWGILDGPLAGDPTLPLAALDRWLPLLTGIVAGLGAAGFVLLSWWVARPALTLLRALPSAGGLRTRLARASVALWRGLRGDPTWRANLLLWLWFTIPVLALVRHSSALYVHYLLVELPVVFVVAGLAADRLLALRLNGALRLRVAASVATIVLLAAVIAGQSLRSLQATGTIAAGHFDAYAYYGFPLSEMQSADQQLGMLQRQQGATAVILETPPDIRYRAPLDYMFVSEQPTRVDVADNCLLLPAPGAGPALLVSTESSADATALLAGLSNARHVAGLPLAGGAPWAVYRVEGAPPALAGEVATGGVSFRDAAGNGLRLDAVAAQEPGVLRLRWTVLAPSTAATSATAAGPRTWYRTGVLASSGTSPSQSGASNRSGMADCQPTRWQAGETLFTWVLLAAPPGGSAAATPPSGSLTIDVFGGTLDLDIESIGPLRVLTDRGGGAGLQALAVSGVGSGPGHITAGGAYELPLSVVGHP
jgi:hypothetical protein